MEKLPDSCSDCAEYGSEFCKDCLDEIAKSLTDSEKDMLTTAMKNIVNSNTNSSESE